MKSVSFYLERFQRYIGLVHGKSSAFLGHPIDIAMTEPATRWLSMALATQ